VRLCLANEYFPPFAPGGAEWSLEALARELAARGHHVVIVTPNYGAAPSETRDGFRVVRFPFPRRLPPGRSWLTPKWLANPLFYLWAAFHLARVARRERAQVLHAQNKQMLIPALLAGRWLRRPVFVTLRDGSIVDAAPVCLHHGDRMPSDCGVRKLWHECSEEYWQLYTRGRGRRLRTKLAFLYFWLDSRLKQRALRRVDGVIGVSEGILDIYRRSGLLASDARARAVYNVPPLSVVAGAGAAARARLGLSAGPVVLYVGKHSPGKGMPDLLAAAPEVVRHVPGTVFILVGDGATGSEAPWLRCLGPRSNPEVLELYGMADVVVVPSVIPDALSRVILEAMAAGCAVVATRVGGTPELVEDGVSGLLVERGQPAALAEAIVRLLRDPVLRRALGAAARRRVALRFAADRSVNELLAAYESLVS
jgi:glycosyltransferase involved in cell wall biosynthesis